MKRFFFLSMLILLLCGCSAERIEERSIFSMDTYMTFKIYGTAEQADSVVAKINELHALLNTSDCNSTIGQLNQSGDCTCSDEFLNLLNTSITISKRTDGAFDPTTYPLSQLWGFPSKDYHVPNAAELEAALKAIGTEHIHIDKNQVTLDTGTQLDFGAIAKGYAGQVCADFLLSQGVSAAVLSLGGNIQTVGTKPDGSPWLVGISNPSQPEESLLSISLLGTNSVVSSGGYHRFFEENGVRYHHILNPSTGCPAENELLSVTIVAKDGSLADGLSTALFVMGLEKACVFYRKSDDFEAIFITKDAIFVTQGLAESISGAEFEVISK